MSVQVIHAGVVYDDKCGQCDVYDDLCQPCQEAREEYDKASEKYDKASEQYEEARSQACENGRGFVVHYWNPDSERRPTTPWEDTLKEYATAYNGEIDVYIVYTDEPFSGSDTRAPVTYFYGEDEGEFSLLEIEKGDWVTGVCEKAGKHVFGSSWEPVTELEEDE
ncbi:hypothetical protein BDV33DRAFT_201922 [Aspergillus novoparasiticus]|uniref:Uncharacterized protein n=1 Tax=Aspergillus novoparasiticus TaxID=986946 RepID=A0A5N6EZG8_9EURO|nr:hypothetical protein BDV33DRAFT_201922 [Aspergillus novoparasiticus]